VLPALEAPAETLWAEVWGETGRGKDRIKVWDPFADERCSQTILDFLSTRDVGRLAPAVEDAQSGAPQCEHRKRREREEEYDLGAASFVLSFVFLL